MHRKTQIICTLGPASDSLREITRLIESGMNVARFNFSHGTYEHHSKILNNLRKAEALTGKKILTLADLQGPKIRIGLMRKELICLPGKLTNFPITVPAILKYLKPGQRLLANDGLVELQIEKILDDKIHCRALTQGILKSGNGLNFPDTKIKLPPLTAKDLQDLDFILAHNFDFIALSFVKEKSDLKALKKHLGNNPIKIIAKIERHEAVKNLKSLIKTADLLMVARGDLGVDIAPEQVPLVQKHLLHLTRKANKPAIVATQVLQTMIKNPIPTRAEISDAANAVIDRANYIMLSNETAVGRYPFRACATLEKVIFAVEKALKKNPHL